jgi:hypothetical protein
MTSASVSKVAANMNTTDCTLTDHDILSMILSFVDLPDVSAVSRTSKQFKRSLEAVEDELFHSLVKYRCKRQYPTLVKRKDQLPPDEQSWKVILHKTLVSSYYKPVGSNKKLQKALEAEFRNEGIVAFSNCCTYNCSSAYNKYDPFFIPREKGIYFVKFILNGKNYFPYYSRLVVSAWFEDFEYLVEHWESECKILVRWCQVLGLKEGDFTIHKPEYIHTCVMIEFKVPIKFLEYPPGSGDLCFF